MPRLYRENFYDGSPTGLPPPGTPKPVVTKDLGAPLPDPEFTQPNFVSLPLHPHEELARKIAERHDMKQKDTRNMVACVIYEGTDYHTCFQKALADLDEDRQFKFRNAATEWLKEYQPLKRQVQLFRIGHGPYIGRALYEARKDTATDKYFRGQIQTGMEARKRYDHIKEQEYLNRLEQMGLTHPMMETNKAIDRLNSRFSDL